MKKKPIDIVKVIIFSLAAIGAIIFITGIVIAGCKKGQEPTPQIKLLFEWVAALNVILLTNFGAVIGVGASQTKPNESFNFRAFVPFSEPAEVDSNLQKLACVFYLAGLVIAAVFFFFVPAVGTPGNLGSHLPLISDLTKTLGSLIVATLALILGVKK